MAEVKQRIVSMESSLEKLDQQEIKYSQELNMALIQYAEGRQQAESMDARELDTARQSVRPDMEHEAARRLQGAYGKQFDSQMLIQSRKDITVLLDEGSDIASVHQELQQTSNLQYNESTTRKPHLDER